MITYRDGRHGMVCDVCGAFTTVPGQLAPGAQAIRRHAKAAGWIRRKDGPAGTTRDYCPTDAKVTP